jgi:O-antigen ligase
MTATSGVGLPGASLRWLPASQLVVAGALGVVAVISPLAAILLAGALVFTAVAFHDLAAGIALFTVLIFLESVPGVAGSELGAVKAAGVILVLSALRRSGTPLLLKEFPGLAFAAVAFAAWAVTSAAWARDDGRAAGYGLRLVLGITLVFVVFAGVRETRHARWVIWGYIAGSAASAVVGFFGPTYAANTERLGGGLGDPNFLAAMLVPAMVFALFALSWTTQTLVRWLLIGCVPLFAVSLFLTQSRGGLVAAAVALVAALVFAGPARGRFVILLGVLISVGLVYYTALASPEAVARLSSPGGGTGRTDLWSIAAGIAADHPVFGIGGGNFTLVAPEYASHAINLTSVHVIVDRPQVTHNTYLGLLAELGVIGLVAFVVLVASALLLAWRSTRLLTDTADVALEPMCRAVLVSLIAILAAFAFLSGATEKPLWLLVGLAVSLHGLARREAAIVARS